MCVRVFRESNEQIAVQSDTVNVDGERRRRRRVYVTRCGHECVFVCVCVRERERRENESDE